MNQMNIIYLIIQKNKWNKVSHYIGKDYYTLTADGIGGTLILRKKENYPNGFYTTNVCKVIIFYENIFSNFFYYTYQNAKNSVDFDFGHKANNDNLSKINIKIPKDKQIFNEKEYPSFQIQQSIVKLLEERFKSIEKAIEFNMDLNNILNDKAKKNENRNSLETLQEQKII